MLRPATPALLLLLTLTLAATAAALPPLDLEGLGVQLRTEVEAPAAEAAFLPAQPEAPPALGAGPLPAPLLEEVLAAPLELHSRSGVLPGLALGPKAQSTQSAGPAPSSPPARSEPAPEAEMAAVGALAAAGTLALKLEPVRRGLFLLALPLYSRLRKNQLLENGVRERIFRAIEAQPGLSIIQVCRSAKVGWGTSVYHLQRLERDRMIVSRRDGQYRRFFLTGQAPKPGEASPGDRALQHPLALRIAAFVAGNPGVVQKDVCAALGISPPLASKWLGRLLEAGLVTSEREWKHVRYAPTPQLAARLAAPPPQAASAAAVVEAGLPA